MVSVKPMKLKGHIRLEDDLTLVFESTVYDGGKLSINPRVTDVQLNGAFANKKKRVEGWVHVQQESQQGNIVYIKLPAPSIQHGHYTIVNENQLMPRVATLEDFGAKKKPKGVTVPAGVNAVTPENGVTPPVVEENQDLPDE
jgi:hypothetical protein